MSHKRRPLDFSKAGIVSLQPAIVPEGQLSYPIDNFSVLRRFCL
jgi:hypothetical protein